VNISIDANKLFDSAVAALSSGKLAPILVFLLVGLIMLPWIIPAASNAIAQQRALSHKREEALRKIRNSTLDRSSRHDR
jgi:hypothetical protein